MSSDRTPAEALAHARYTVEGYGEDHPWHVAWDAMRPTLRQELVEDAEEDIAHLIAAGFRVVPEPDDAPGSLPDRLRQIADDLMYGRTASTHSDACWQWHESCALNRAADLLSGDGARKEEM